MMFNYSYAPNLTDEQRNIQANEWIECQKIRESQIIDDQKDIKDIILLNHLKMSNFTKEDRQKIRDISNQLKVDESWMYRVFRIESGGNPKAVNYQQGDPIDPWKRVLLGRATGLIQWLPSSAILCGTTTKELYNMRLIKQLDYVKTYILLATNGKKIKNFLDFYLAFFRPDGIGKPNNYILGYKNSKVVKENSHLAKDSVITVHDVKTFIAFL